MLLFILLRGVLEYINKHLIPVIFIGVVSFLAISVEMMFANIKKKILDKMEF